MPQWVDGVGAPPATLENVDLSWADEFLGNVERWKRTSLPYVVRRPDSGALIAAFEIERIVLKRFIEPYGSTALDISETFKECHNIRSLNSDPTSRANCRFTWHPVSRCSQVRKNHPAAAYKKVTIAASRLRSKFSTFLCNVI